MCFWPYHYKKRTHQRKYRVHNEYILKQYQTKYIIIPSFQAKTFIHLQGKYPQTIYMCLCIIPELNYV